MTPAQLLKLIDLLRGREGDILAVSIDPYGLEQNYSVEIRTLQPDGSWQLTMDKTI